MLTYLDPSSPLYIDDFSFTTVDTEAKDGLAIVNPIGATCSGPNFLRSRKTLEEHILFIKEKQIKKASIIAEDIGFLTRCPSLEYICIQPARTAVNFDYSPLYEMPNLKYLCCYTRYGEWDSKTTEIDYSHFDSLDALFVTDPSGHENLETLRGLKELSLTDGAPPSCTLEGIDFSQMVNLRLIQASVRSLKGIRNAQTLKHVVLYYNRRLNDISDLVYAKDSLTSLDIENCGRVKDLSVLRELHNLEYLRLKGSQVIPDISFLDYMPKLKGFELGINVENGELSRLDRIPNVMVWNRKHYNRKNEDYESDGF